MSDKTMEVRIEDWDRLNARIQELKAKNSELQAENTSIRQELDEICEAYAKLNDEWNDQNQALAKERVCNTIRSPDGFRITVKLVDASDGTKAIVILCEQDRTEPGP